MAAVPLARSVAHGLVLHLAVALGACGRAPAATSDAGATPASPAAAASSLCRAAEARCLGDGEAEICRADEAAWEKRACTSDQVCLAGQCVSLEAPAPASRLDRARLLALRGEGWLDAWAVSAPLSTRTIQTFQETPTDPTSAGTNATWKSVCAADGIVRVLGSPDQRQKPPAFALLAGYLVAARNRQVQLKAGVTGVLRVWVNGTLALEASRVGAGRPIPDEVIALVDLHEGVNAVTVVLEQPDETAPEFGLRLHDLDNRTSGDLFWATLVPQAGCTAADLVHAPVVPTPRVGGFTVEIAPRVVGLAPRNVSEMTVAAELRKDAGKTLAEIGKHRLAMEDIVAGRARIDLPLSPPRAGKYEMALRITPGDTEARKTSFSYAGELHDRIAHLMERAAAASTWPVPEGSRASFAHHVDRLRRALVENEADTGWLAKMTGDAEAIGAALATGDDAYRARTGYVYRAYRSPLDGQLQPYVVWVPRSYKPSGKPVPVVLAFHGKDRLPEHGLRTVIGEAPDDTMSLAWAARHLPSPANAGVLVAAPWSYGNASPKGMGEEDALRVIDELRAAYTVDERRISVTGYSLGGTASFVLPLHYPDRFSASAPLCGYPNLATYESVRKVRHTPSEEVLISKRYIVNYAENGLHLPLNIVHGGQDGPGRSQVVADRYKDLGYARIFDVQEELDHNVWDYAYEDGKMIEWLRAKRRPERPDRVRLVSGEERYDRSYWVRLLSRRESLQFAEVDATWVEKEGVLKVTTSNVAAFAVTLEALSPPAGARAVVDGAELPLPDGARSVFFERSTGSWQTVGEEPSRAGRKRPGVSGPLDDVQRHPVVFVYGTQDPTETETNRLVAEHLAVYDTFSGGRFPIKADVDVPDAELAGRSLVLVGRPSTNRVTRALAPALPVRFEAGAVTFRGRRYEGEDVGVSLIHPNPRDAAEYVVLHAGVGYRGTLAARHLPQLAPDYLVYDGRITVQRGELLLDRRVVLDGGFFGDDWK